MIYEGNPKHKHPWQPGRRGSLCPRSISIQPQELLERSILGPDGKRYATCDGRCFCAQEGVPPAIGMDTLLDGAKCLNISGANGKPMARSKSAISANIGRSIP